METLPNNKLSRLIIFHDAESYEEFSSQNMIIPDDSRLYLYFLDKAVLSLEEAATLQPLANTQFLACSFAYENFNLDWKKSYTVCGLAMLARLLRTTSPTIWNQNRSFEFKDKNATPEQYHIEFTENAFTYYHHPLEPLRIAAGLSEWLPQLKSLRMSISNGNVVETISNNRKHRKFWTEYCQVLTKNQIFLSLDAGHTNQELNSHEFFKSFSYVPKDEVMESTQTFCLRFR